MVWCGSFAGTGKQEFIGDGGPAMQGWIRRARFLSDRRWRQYLHSGPCKLAYTQDNARWNHPYYSRDSRESRNRILWGRWARAQGTDLSEQCGCRS